MEELLPKDNENILLPLVGPATPSEPAAFTPSEMIRCEQCLRANPPTRPACLYCGAPLPVSESSARLRKPVLLSADKSQPGYNSIFVSWDQSRNSVTDPAELLKLPVDVLEKIVSGNECLPIARTGTLEEAQLLSEKLYELGLQTETRSDEELGISERNVIRVRSILFDEEQMQVRASGRGEPSALRYTDLVLLVQGRLLIKTTAIKERQARGAENEILDASEFYSDQFVADLYASAYDQTWRIEANNFDFSCLSDRKALVVRENMTTLIQTFTLKSPALVIDNSYDGHRGVLDLVWGSEKVTRSDGWRRDAPGRVTVGATTTHSNESQFTRYSRLKYHLLRQQ